MEGHLFLARREHEAEWGPQCGVPTVEDCGRLSEQEDRWHPRQKASKVSWQCKTQQIQELAELAF